MQLNGTCTYSRYHGGERFEKDRRAGRPLERSSSIKGLLLDRDTTFHPQVPLDVGSAAHWPMPRFILSCFFTNPISRLLFGIGRSLPADIRTKQIRFVHWGKKPCACSILNSCSIEIPLRFFFYIQGESKVLVCLVWVDRWSENKNSGKCRILLKSKLIKLFELNVVQF